MTLYTRPQLIVLLVVVLVAGAGLGVGHWRRTHPDLAERLERFDRVPTGFSPTVPDLPLASAPRSVRAPAPARADVPTPPSAPVDVNRATEDELRTLPGIGGVLAARIVEARERDGPFTSVDDLRRVRGVGRAKLAGLGDALTLTLAPAR